MEIDNKGELSGSNFKARSNGEKEKQWKVGIGGHGVIKKEEEINTKKILKQTIYVIKDGEKKKVLIS